MRSPCADLLERTLRKCVDAGVDFLARAQLDHGEIPSYQFLEPNPEAAGRFDSSPFVTALVLDALCELESGTARSIVDRGMCFLADEMEGPGLWSYWSSRNHRSIDPDLDDTSCISFLFRRLGRGEEVSGNLDTILANRTQAGLFKTWLRAPDQPNDVDSVVNANILLYLGERDETRAACAAICQAVEAGVEKDTYWYYLDELALYAMVARAYRHGHAGLGRCRETVVRRISSRQLPDGSFGSPLRTALALAAWLDYGADIDLEPGVRYLLHNRREDGSWPAELFYCGPEPPATKSVWWGSDALTTGLCVAALKRSTDIVLV
jgi:hypothetical protein